jgi:hypothetical protein
MEWELVPKESTNAPPRSSAPIGLLAQYTGPERRLMERRDGQDRRAMIRFELTKPGRRQLQDRRAAYRLHRRPV